MFNGKSPLLPKAVLFTKFTARIASTKYNSMRAVKQWNELVGERVAIRFCSGSYVVM